MNVSEVIASRLRGNHLVSVKRRDYDWLMSFQPGIKLRIECPWRILKGGRIVFGDADHAQQFGLPNPIDGVAQSETLLMHSAIQRLTIRDDTADMTIAFSNKNTLEILNTSCGYEGWELWEEKANGLIVVAQGGGNVVIWSDSQVRARQRRTEN
jgi:hypothetical protein